MKTAGALNTDFFVHNGHVVTVTHCNGEDVYTCRRDNAHGTTRFDAVVSHRSDTYKLVTSRQHEPTGKIGAGIEDVSVTHAAIEAAALDWLTTARCLSGLPEADTKPL